MNGIDPPASVAVATAPVATAEAGVTVSAALDSWITNSEKDVVSAAEAMPEEKYSFACQRQVSLPALAPSRNR